MLSNLVTAIFLWWYYLFKQFAYAAGAFIYKDKEASRELNTLKAQRSPISRKKIED
jgi:hypothetical protein